MQEATSLPSNLVSTDTIIGGATYAAGTEAFFLQMRPLWATIRSIVQKLETRQVYSQEGNPSFDALESGDFRRAIELLPRSVEGDRDLYESLRSRRVEFVRCRPLEFPLTNYMRWELEHYKLNAQEGERIYCCDLKDHRALFSDYAKHDFMIFDQLQACVHDYDADGCLRGGWIISDAERISELQRLYAWVRSSSRPFETFLS